MNDINRTQNLKPAGPDKIHNFGKKKIQLWWCTHSFSKTSKLVPSFNPSTFPIFLCRDVTYLKRKDDDTTNPLKYKLIILTKY